MSVWSVLGRVLPKLAPLVPKAIDLIRDATRKRPLEPPLGESEAARALRLEEERRAAVAAERARRAKD